MYVCVCFIFCIFIPVYLYLMNFFCLCISKKIDGSELQMCLAKELVPILLATLSPPPKRYVLKGMLS